VEPLTDCRQTADRGDRQVFTIDAAAACIKPERDLRAGTTFTTVMTTAAQPRRNVEQKFRCGDLKAARAAALDAGAVQVQTLRQRDIYFHAQRGRLKLRSIESDLHTTASELIAYQRPDGEAERTCTYHILPVTQPQRVEVLLGAVLGIRAIVRKSRRLLMSDSLRIHLDEVEELGSFVEFEAVLGPGHEEPEGRRLIAVWRALLGLSDSVPVSYVDLLESQSGAALAPAAAAPANV